MQGIGRQPAATCFAEAEDAAGADLPQFVKDEFAAVPECGILAHGFRRCGDDGHDKPDEADSGAVCCPAGPPARKRPRR